jgi:HPr kinase/phosphorylase
MMAEDACTLHGTCVAVAGAGVLILGPPGSGKSDLALRLIDSGAGELVADDQVSVVRRGARLIASAPKALAGLLEIRGLGIVPVKALNDVALSLVVNLAAASQIERLPEGATHGILGVALPSCAIDPSLASAAARVRAAVRYLAGPD